MEMKRPGIRAANSPCVNSSILSLDLPSKLLLSRPTLKSAQYCAYHAKRKNGDSSRLYPDEGARTNERRPPPRRPHHEWFRRAKSTGLRASLVAKGGGPPSRLGHLPLLGALVHRFNGLERERQLCVTNAVRRARAMEAIIRSLGPIGVP